MEENRVETVTRPQNKNLKTDAGPGRPLGQRNYATIYMEAMRILADKNSTTPEALEAEMIANAAVLARKGDYRFYKDILDRIHGSATIKTDIMSDGKPILQISEEIARKYGITPESKPNS